MILFAAKYGVTKAAFPYEVDRQYIYRRMKRYDGTLESLRDMSRHPHSHPNEHTQEEIELIQNMLRRNRNTGLVVLWVKPRQRGYGRSISGLHKAMRRIGAVRMPLSNPKQKYVPKPYEQMKYPGQRVQVDVKYVPNVCLAGEASGKKFYQYTAIDEHSRFRYAEAFDENSTYTAALFSEHMIQRFKFRIERVQTDNGREFTNRFSANKDKPTLFEKSMASYGIRHKLIKPYTPRHNGKVERSHRKDNEYFCATHKFYSLSDFTKQLANWPQTQ